MGNERQPPKIPAKQSTLLLKRKNLTTGMMLLVSKQMEKISKLTKKSCFRIVNDIPMFHLPHLMSMESKGVFRLWQSKIVLAS
jgi:hypothetical protein